MLNEFDALNEEQLNYLRDQVDARLKQSQGGGEPKVTVRLPNGQQVSGTSQEVEAAFQRYAQENSAQARLETQVQNNQATTQLQKPEWSYDTFVDRFKDDPRRGLEYYNQCQYGFDPGQAVQQLYGAAVEMYQEVQRLQAAEASRQFPDLQKPENREVVDKIIKQNGWNRSSQTLEQAYYIAKGQGMIKEETPKPQWQPTTPSFPDQPNNFSQNQNGGAFGGTVPYIPGNGGWESASDFVTEFDQKTREVPTNDLRGMIESIQNRNFSPSHN